MKFHGVSSLQIMWQLLVKEEKGVNGRLELTEKSNWLKSSRLKAE